MEFDYFKQTMSMASLEVEDIGNVCIEANTDLGECFYLIIKTTMGTTNIVTYGPIVPGIDILEKECSCSFKRMDFNEGKIIGVIKNFLNQPKKLITQAQIVELEKVCENCINIIDYIRKEDSY